MSRHKHKWGVDGRCSECHAIQPGADWFRQQREKRGLTQAYIATEVLRVNRVTVSRYERGDLPISYQVRRLLELFYENLMLREMFKQQNPELTFIGEER